LGEGSIFLEADLENFRLRHNHHHVVVIRSHFKNQPFNRMILDVLNINSNGVSQMRMTYQIKACSDCNTHKEKVKSWSISLICNYRSCVESLELETSLDNIIHSELTHMPTVFEIKFSELGAEN
jgi:hypothetical protein